MPDPLRIEPHPESERTYHELRSEFRAINLQRIRSLLKDYRLNGVKMKLMGLPMALQGDIDCFDSKGLPVTLKAGTPEHRAATIQFALDATVTQNFGLEDVPEDIRKQLDELIGECDLSERVTWADGTEGVVDHDAPPVPIPFEDLSEKEQLDYVDRAIEESKEKI